MPMSINVHVHVILPSISILVQTLYHFQEWDKFHQHICSNEGKKA